jgi:hypothetical protein
MLVVAGSERSIDYHCKKFYITALGFALLLLSADITMVSLIIIKHIFIYFLKDWAFPGLFF